MSSANLWPSSCHQLSLYHNDVTTVDFSVIRNRVWRDLQWASNFVDNDFSLLELITMQVYVQPRVVRHQLTSWIAFPTLTLMTLMSLTRSSHIHMSVMLMQLDWKSKPWVLCHAAPKTLSSPVVVSNYVQCSLMVDLPVLTSLAHFISLTRNPVDHGKTNSSFISYIVFVLLLHLQPKIPISRRPDLTPTKFRGINTFTALHNVIMSTAQHVPAKMILDSGAGIFE